MSNPYSQVALTYLRRPFSSIRAFIMVGGFVGIMLSPFFGSMLSHRSAQDNARLWFGDQQSSGSPFSMMFFGGSGILFGLAAIHIKEQFANPRAQLTPDFRRVHIAGATVAFVVLAVVMPAILAAMAGIPCVSMVAIAVLWFDMVLWFVLIQSATFSLFAMLVFFAVLFGPGARILQQLCCEPFRAYAGILLLIGLVPAFLGRRWLLRLNEDMPEYHRRMQPNWSGKSMTTSQFQTGQDILPRGLKDRLQERQMTSLTRHALRAADSRWSRVCRWQVGMMPGWMIALISLLIPLVMFGTVWLVSSSMGKKLVMSSDLPVILCSILPAMPLWVILFVRRTQFLSYESLLPVSRVGYLRQVGMATALNQLQLWIGVTAATVLWWRIVVPEQSQPNMANLLAFSALSQVGFFGIMVWFVRLRSRLLAVLPMIVAMQIGAMVATLFHQGPLSAWQPFLLPAVLVFSAIGIILACDAYRRWLRTDFD